MHNILRRPGCSLTLCRSCGSLDRPLPQPFLCRFIVKNLVSPLDIDIVRGSLESSFPRRLPSLIISSCFALHYNQRPCAFPYNCEATRKSYQRMVAAYFDVEQGIGPAHALLSLAEYDVVCADVLGELCEGLRPWVSRIHERTLEGSCWRSAMMDSRQNRLSCCQIDRMYQEEARGSWRAQL